MAEEEQCSICIEPFTKQAHKKQAKCPYCNVKACVKCTQTYLLGTSEDAHCMECRKAWTRETLDTILLTTWLNGEYKKHRENVLLDREKSRLPAAQIIIARRKQAEEYFPERQKVADEIKELLEKLEQKNQRIAYINTIISIYNAGQDPFENSTAKEHVERRTFIMPCPASGCRGFLSSAYKCGVCDIYVCPDCREIKGTNRDIPHTCDPNTVETVRAIKKETRPCPECGTNIFKIEGCFAKDTPILLWNGTTKMSQDIQIGDILVGDDGLMRNVIHTMTGEDKLFEVKQNDGANYIVNSKHTLILKYSGEKHISWSDKYNQWKVAWFDRKEKVQRTKTFKITDSITKDDALHNAKSFISSLNIPESVELTIEEYMKLDKWSKKNMMGYKSANGVQWDAKDISLDPYLLGIWLGDGTDCNACIASNDSQIQNYILDWCEKNDAEMIHEHTVQFRIRRRGAINGKDVQRLAISHGSDSENCKGCQTKKMSICDTPNKLDDQVEENMHKSNPFLDELKKYNLLQNKHIPLDYIMNSRETRLKVLAGIIDSDGHVPVDQHGKRVVIKLTNEKLVKDCVMLSKSLGFVVHITKTERKNISVFGQPSKDYSDVYTINLSGEKLHEIPTLLPRKKCVGTSGNKDYMRTSIQVTELGKGTYYGWTIDNNHRFLHEDFTVLRNCDQMFCTNCKTPFSWKTGKKVVTGAIHNPHYFEYMRVANGGVMPRNPGDIPCGAHLPNAWTFEREVIRRFPGLSATDTDWLMQSLRQITHIQHVDVPSLINRAEDMDNTEHNIRYLRNEIDEVHWKRLLQQREKRRIKRDEMRMRLEAFVATCIDIYGPVMDYARSVFNTTTANLSAQPDVKKEMAKRVKQAREHLEALRTIFNEGMMEISKRYKCQVTQLSEKALLREFKKYESGRVKRVKQGDTSTVGEDSDE